MRKSAALLLALSMLFALAACEKDTKVDPTSESMTETTNSTQCTNDPTSCTQLPTQEPTEAATEGTEGSLPTETTSFESEPTEPLATEPCDHEYVTDGMTDCAGILTYVCKKCQHSYGEETGKYWHQMICYYVKQPTLTEDGIFCEECTRCQQKDVRSVGKLLPTHNAYMNRLHCFFEVDSPLNTELYTWQGKAKGILCYRYPNEITEQELFTDRRCWEYDISRDEIEKIKTTEHYNASKNVFLSYNQGSHPPVLTTYLGYKDNGDGTVTAYASILVRVVEGIYSDYVESGFCKIEMKYGTPPTDQQMATFHITSIMRVESVPTDIIT